MLITLNDLDFCKPEEIWGLNKMMLARRSSVVGSSWDKGVMTTSLIRLWLIVGITNESLLRRKAGLLDPGSHGAALGNLSLLWT